MKCRGITLKASLCKRYTTLENGFCSSHQHQAKIKGSHEMCGICLEKVEKYEVLECGHLIHRNCMKKTHKVECPICRTELQALPHRIKERIERNAERAYIEDSEDNIMTLVYDIIRRTFSSHQHPTVIDGMIIYYDESTNVIHMHLSNEE